MMLSLLSTPLEVSKSKVRLAMVMLPDMLTERPIVTVLLLLP